MNKFQSSFFYQESGLIAHEFSGANLMNFLDNLIRYFHLSSFEINTYDLNPLLRKPGRGETAICLPPLFLKTNICGALPTPKKDVRPDSRLCPEV